MQTAQRLTLAHKARQVELGKEAARSAAELWPLLDPVDVHGTKERWVEAMVPLVVRMWRVSADVAAVYLEAWAQAKGVSVEVPAESAESVAALEEALRVSLLVTGPLSLLTPTQAHGLTHAQRTALSRVIGAVIRHVMNGGRGKVIDTINASPDLVGWRRVVSPGACDFCLMLADRGAVYSAETARFAAHDNCSCTVEPAVGGESVKVLPYTPTKRRKTGHDRWMLREYLRDLREEA